MNKKKYLKIGFVSIFILFIIFVIARKINIDKNLEQIQEKKKEETPKIIKEKKTNLAIQTKLSDTTSTTNEEIIPLKETIEKKKQNIVSPVKNLSNTPIEKIKEPIVTEIELEDISREDNISEKEIDKVIKKITDKKNEPAVEIVKTVNEQITIKTIADLKNIKSQISIDPKQKSFSYKKNNFEENDKFGDFKVINIYNKKIRFKINNNYYYNLRFYK